MFSASLLVDSIVNSLVALMVVSAVVILTADSLGGYIRLYRLQSTMLGLVCAGVALDDGASHLFAVALLVLIVKALLMPAFLSKVPGVLRSLTSNSGSIAALGLLVDSGRDSRGYLANDPGARDHSDSRIPVALAVAASACLMALSYYISYPIFGEGDSEMGVVVSGALAASLIGTLIMIAKLSAVGQIVGFLVMENGMFLTGMVLTKGMPILVEVGAMFDLVVAALLMSRLTHRMGMVRSSTDVDRLRLLRG